MEGVLVEFCSSWIGRVEEHQQQHGNENSFGPVPDRPRYYSSTHDIFRTHNLTRKLYTFSIIHGEMASSIATPAHRQSQPSSTAAIVEALESTGVVDVGVSPQLLRRQVVNLVVDLNGVIPKIVGAIKFRADLKFRGSVVLDSSTPLRLLVQRVSEYAAEFDWRTARTKDWGRTAGGGCDGGGPGEPKRGGGPRDWGRIARLGEDRENQIVAEDRRNSIGGPRGGAPEEAGEPTEEAVEHRESFLAGKPLGIAASKWAVKCYVKTAYLYVTSYGVMLKRTVLRERPVVLVTRIEADSVDRRSRIKSCWSAKQDPSHSSWCQDSGAKVMVFWARVGFFLRKKVLLRGVQQRVFFRVRVPTLPILLPNIGGGGYKSRDQGRDLYDQVTQQICRLEFDSKEFLSPPVQIVVSPTDSHGTMLNFHSIAVEKNNEVSAYLRWVWWPIACLIHPLSTLLVESSYIMFLWTGNSPTEWMRRIVLNAINMQNRIGMMHIDIELQLDQGRVLSRRTGILPEQERGHWASLLSLCGLEEILPDWEDWENVEGELVFFDRGQCGGGGVEGRLTDLEWEEKRLAQYCKLHAIFSAPTKPAEQKWFTTCRTTGRLLICSSVAPKHLMNLWLRGTFHIQDGTFHDFAAGEESEEEYRLLNYCYMRMSRCFEHIQKRTLVVSEKISRKQEAESYRLLSEEAQEQIDETVAQIPWHIKIICPQTCKKSPEQVAAIVLRFSTAVRWSIIVGVSIVEGKTSLQRGEHNKVLQEWIDPENADRRRELFQKLCDKYTERPRMQTADLGPNVLHDVVRTCLTYPTPADQFGAMNDVFFSVAHEDKGWKSHTIQLPDMFCIYPSPMAPIYEVLKTRRTIFKRSYLEALRKFLTWLEEWSGT